MMTDLTWSFNIPVRCFLFIETALIANKIFHLAPLVFSSGYAKHFIALIPQPNFSYTLFAITVCIKCIHKPDTAFETECFVCQGADRTNVNHVSGEIIFNYIFYIGTDFGNITTVHD